MASASLRDMNEYRFTERYLPAAISVDVIAENERSVVQQMISLRLLGTDAVPTAGGLLLVGNDPEAFVPGAYVQYNRYDGDALTDPLLDTKRLSGTIDEQLSAIDEVLRLNIRTQVDILSGDKDVKSSDYPVAALQQFARNAIMHRNYESNAPTRIYWFGDRLEIHNPGGPFGQVTARNFGTGVTDYRNPLIAEGMRYYGFVQRFGVGIAIARKALADNGNAEPKFDIGETSIAVVVRKR